MANPQYIDISGWQEPSSIDWAKYKAWSASVDGKSRVAIKINEGTAGIDANCHAHWNNALEAGIDVLILYHFARPDLNPGQAGAQNEAASFKAQLGNGLRSSDYVMLDFEQAPENAGWAQDFLEASELLEKLPPERIAIYANLNTVQTVLSQDNTLATFELILADWTFSATELPAAPLPWHSLLAVQYTDKASIPGVSESVDADVFLHSPSAPPAPAPVGPDLAKVKAGLASAIASLQSTLKLLG